MNVYSKFIILGVLIIGMATGMVSALFSFQELSKNVATHTNLSAWSLAQLELEYQKFCTELELYRAGRSDPDKLALAYDLAWNRMDVFLHGAENESVRHSFDADALIKNVFTLIQKNEDLINTPVTPNSPALAEWETQLLKYQPLIRQLMIKNFTGPGATRNMESLDVAVTHISWVLFVVSLLSLLMGYLLFRESRKHWFLSLHDPLTKLINRAHFQELLQERCHQADIKKQSLLLCLLDVSRFHEVNNMFGYQSGDQLLQRISMILKDSFGSGALIARTGSSEFALLLPNNDVTLALPAALDVINAELREYDPANRVHLCSGISFFPEQSRLPTELFQFADFALSAAKNKTGHSQFFNDAMLANFQRRRELATHLRAQLEHIELSDLYLCYQPIHSLNNRETLGLEVLLRWKHSLFGYIPPPEIIEIAEEHGLGTSLGDWIFRKMQADLAKLPFRLLERLSVSINLSDSMFTAGLAERIKTLMLHSPIHQQQLILELTETIALSDFSGSQQILKSLREIGVRIALDDFGTGFSSLAYLKDLSVDKLKIDKSFIQQVHLDERQLCIVRYITELAHDFNLIVVAEGVELEDELQIVTSMGVEEVQGYFYSKPLEPALLSNYLSQYFSASLPH